MRDGIPAANVRRYDDQSTSSAEIPNLRLRDVSPDSERKFSSRIYYENRSTYGNQSANPLSFDGNASSDSGYPRSNSRSQQRQPLARQRQLRSQQPGRPREETVFGSNLRDHGRPGRSPSHDPSRRAGNESWSGRSSNGEQWERWTESTQGPTNRPTKSNAIITLRQRKKRESTSRESSPLVPLQHISPFLSKWRIRVQVANKSVVLKWAKENGEPRMTSWLGNIVSGVQVPS